MDKRNLGSHEDGGRSSVLVNPGCFYRGGSLWGGCDWEEKPGRRSAGDAVAGLGSCPGPAAGENPSSAFLQKHLLQHINVCSNTFP